MDGGEGAILIVDVVWGFFYEVGGSGWRGSTVEVGEGFGNACEMFDIKSSDGLFLYILGEMDAS